MKLLHPLLLAAAASAFVLPDEQMTAQLVLENKRPARSGFDIGSFHDLRAELEGLIRGAKKTVKCHKQKLEEQLGELVEPFADIPWETAETVAEKAKAWTHSFDAESWFGQDDLEALWDGPHWGPPHRDPHDGPPHDGPPHHKPPHRRPPHHKPPHRKPHKRPDLRNYTIWQVINHSNYTSKFAHFVSNYSDIVQVLNSTKANHTLFVPTNKAFEHIHGNYTPPKWFIEKVLEYHIAPGLYPAGRVLASPTIPTLFNSRLLGNFSQRTRVSLGLKGVTLNFEVGVYPVNIVTKNGIIHGLDKILLPLPPTLVIIKALPQMFSTLQLAINNANLTAPGPWTRGGGTVFLPTNRAWATLPSGVLRFLFSNAGTKYLRALLKYHAAENQTLYSDAFYNADSKEQTLPGEKWFHVDLPSILGPPISADVKRWGLWSSITLNGFTKVDIANIPALDAALHTIPYVLVPPRKPGRPLMAADEELTVEEFKSRFDFADDGAEAAEDSAWAQMDL